MHIVFLKFIIFNSKMEKKPKKSSKSSKSSKISSESTSAKELSEKPIKIPKCISSSKSGKIILTVEAKPSSKQDKITEICDEFIGVAVQAEPKGGEANANIVEFLADVLKIKKTQITFHEI